MLSPIWLSRDAVLDAHQELLERYRGVEGVRDANALESALARPRNLFVYGGAQVDLFDMAAAYGYGLARNHPFVDGNKRTALFAIWYFLELNYIEIEASEEERFHTIRQLAAGDVSEPELADWLRRREKL